jgi:hypothetical protein
LVGVTEILPKVGARWYSNAASRSDFSASLSCILALSMSKSPVGASKIAGLAIPRKPRRTLATWPG